MDPPFNGQLPPDIEPRTVQISRDHRQAESRLTLTNRSPWPIVFKVKVQESILNVCKVYPAQAIVGAGSSTVISLRFEVQTVKEKELDLTSGHRIHVESWYISDEDAARPDSAKLLAEIKTKMEALRKPDISRIRIRYTPSAAPRLRSPLPFRKLSHSAVATVAPLSSREIPISDSSAKPTNPSMSNSKPITGYGMVSNFLGSMLNPWGFWPDYTRDISVAAAAKRHPARDRGSTDPLAIVPPRDEPVLLSTDAPFFLPGARVSLSPLRPTASLSPSPRRSNTLQTPTSFSYTDEEWMPYIPVNGLMRGRVKVPEVSSSGGFSDVFRCEARFATSAETNPRTVAVKVLWQVGGNKHDEADVLQRIVGRLAREVSVWSAVSHPNIVPILGFTATPLVSVISPWFEQGNLHNYLKREPGADRLKLSLDIATGLAYIHSRAPKIVHGDLKPDNILITDREEAVLSDLGLCRVMEENPQCTPPHRRAGSLRWMAPELLLDKERESTSADVWSFGMVLFEVMTGNLPYSDLPASKLWFAICDPSNPKDPVEDWDKYPQLPGPIKETMVKCWSRWPERRPSMRHVEEGLARVLEPRNKGVDAGPKLETLQPNQLGKSL